MYPNNVEGRRENVWMITSRLHSSTSEKGFFFKSLIGQLFSYLTLKILIKVMGRGEDVWRQVRWCVGAEAMAVSGKQASKEYNFWFSVISGFDLISLNSSKVPNFTIGAWCAAWTHGPNIKTRALDHKMHRACLEMRSNWKFCGS